MSNLITLIDNAAALTASATDGENVFLVPSLFDSLVHEHGIKLEHYVALPCPQSDKNLSNIRSNHADHNCDNGFFYKCAGSFVGILTNAPKGNYFRAEGIIDSATAWIVCPRFYENGQTIYFSPYDKIFIDDPEFKKILVPTFEQVQASTTGVDRLRFQACKVTHIIDANGNQTYTEGTDFVINSEGNLQWKSQNRPQYNAVLNEGGVYSVRYLYTPYYYIMSVEHEIRISKVINPDGDKVQARLPQYLRCARERFFRDQENNDQVDSPREGHVPASGSNLNYR